MLGTSRSRFDKRRNAATATRRFVIDNVVDVPAVGWAAFGDHEAFQSIAGVGADLYRNRAVGVDA